MQPKVTAYFEKVCPREKNIPVRNPEVINFRAIILIKTKDKGKEVNVEKKSTPRYQYKP